MERHWMQLFIVCSQLTAFGWCCESYEFPCYNKECIRHNGRCDGKTQCSDGSDEYDCPLVAPTTSTTELPPNFRPCFEGNFQCKNGRCIYKHWRCDGQDDCGDLSDETECPGSKPPGEGPSTLLDTESIIGIAIALIAVALLVAGITAFVVYYRKKFLINDEITHPPRHVSDILEPIPTNLPYNFPREALLREPPPRYTSQQDVNIAHDNAGYNDDECHRPPPYYSSNADIPKTLTACEPPPSYSSRQDLSNLDISLVVHHLPHHVDGTTEAPPLSIHTMLSHSNDSLSSKMDISKDSDKDMKDEWYGKEWDGVPKAVRKQKQVSVSDSQLDRGYLEHPVPQEKPNKHSRGTRQRDQSVMHGGSMTSSKIMTISKFVDQSQGPASLGKWREENLRDKSKQTVSDVTVSQPLPTTGTAKTPRADVTQSTKTQSSPSLELKISHGMLHSNSHSDNASSDSVASITSASPRSMASQSKHMLVNKKNHSVELLNRLSSVNEIDEEPYNHNTTMPLDRSDSLSYNGSDRNHLQFRSQSLPTLLPNAKISVHLNTGTAEC